MQSCECVRSTTRLARKQQVPRGGDPGHPAFLLLDVGLQRGGSMQGQKMSEVTLYEIIWFLFSQDPNSYNMCNNSLDHIYLRWRNGNDKRLCLVFWRLEAFLGSLIMLKNFQVLSNKMSHVYIAVHFIMINEYIFQFKWMSLSCSIRHWKKIGQPPCKQVWKASGWKQELLFRWHFALLGLQQLLRELVCYLPSLGVDAGADKDACPLQPGKLRVFGAVLLPSYK